MRIGEVIGTVTLSRCHPTLQGARWVMAIPLSLECLKNEALPQAEEVIMYDPLNAGIGERIGFSEGGEAAAPFFPQKKPVDAYGACIIDRVNISNNPGRGQS